MNDEGSLFRFSYRYRGDLVGEFFYLYQQKRPVCSKYNYIRDDSIPRSVNSSEHEVESCNPLYI